MSRVSGRSAEFRIVRLPGPETAIRERWAYLAGMAPEMTSFEGEVDISAPTWADSASPELIGE